MEDGPTSEWDSPNKEHRKRNNESPHRTPSPYELMNGVRGALEGKLGRRESPDNLIARNILRAPPTTAGKVATAAQVCSLNQISYIYKYMFTPYTTTTNKLHSLFLFHKI